MILLRFFVYFIFWFAIRLLFLVFAALSIIFPLFPGGGRAGYYSLAGWVLRGLFFCSFLKVEVRGAENLIAGKKYIIINNRPCRFSPLYVVSDFPRRLRFVAMQSLMRLPVVGQVFRGLGCIPYPKEGAGGLEFAGQVFAALQAGDPVVIFYENLRGRSKRSKERGPRVVEIARRCGAEIVPLIVTLAGSRREKDIFLLGKVVIEVKAPLSAPATQDPAEIFDRITSIFAPFVPPL